MDFLFGLVGFRTLSGPAFDTCLHFAEVSVALIGEFDSVEEFWASLYFPEVTGPLMELYA